jgi:hypothetical protein
MLQLEQQVTGNNWEQEIQVMLTCWAGSGASTNTHTGMSYIWYVCREGLEMFATLLQAGEEKMRAEERSEEVT